MIIRLKPRIIFRAFGIPDARGSNIIGAAHITAAVNIVRDRDVNKLLRRYDFGVAFPFMAERKTSRKRIKEIYPILEPVEELAEEFGLNWGVRVKENKWRFDNRGMEQALQDLEVPEDVREIIYETINGLNGDPKFTEAIGRETKYTRGNETTKLSLNHPGKSRRTIDVPLAPKILGAFCRGRSFNKGATPEWISSYLLENEGERLGRLGVYSNSNEISLTHRDLGEGPTLHMGEYLTDPNTEYHVPR